MTNKTYEVKTEIDCCFDDTLLSDVIEVLQDIQNGKYKGAKAISVIIPKHLVVLDEGGTTILTIEQGNL